MSDSQENSKSRTLVLCFDGTASEYCAANTNVVKLYAMLSVDANKQLCYYQAGVGTYFKPGAISPLFASIAKLADEALAWYLDAHVMEGYTFLMQNYRPGDRICIFGFSRGAYTARALGGMLYKVGLLSKDNYEQIPFAYKLYLRTDQEGKHLAAGFKQTFAQNVTIEFMGVWDTVASVGVVAAKTLPFTNSNTSIKTFRHALSLDEHRAKFRPSFFHGPYPHPSDAQSTNPVAPKTDVLEVWFSGCHADDGGSAVPDTTKLSLANITLRWMVREIMTANCGIYFDEAALARYGINWTPPITPVKASPQELHDDKPDATQPLHDQLVERWLWWILELIPTQYAYQDAVGKWHSSWSIHLGKGRLIPDHGPESPPKFHVSVKERLADKALKYTPKAKWKAGTEVYVE